MFKDKSLEMESGQDKKKLVIRIESDSSDVEENASRKSDEKPAMKENGWSCYLRYLSLIVLIVQNTALVLLMSYASRRNRPQFLKTVAVFYNEVFKLIAATILFVVSTGSLKESFSLFKQHFIVEWFDTLKVGVPAIIYTIQNFLVYIAIDHLDATTYMVTYQLKILTTALFTTMMLKRRLSFVQWISLYVLIAGIVLVQINAGNGGSKVSTFNATVANATMPDVQKANSTMPNELEFNPMMSNSTMGGSAANSTNLLGSSKAALEASTGHITRRPWIGLVCVLIACFMSGFAGIYFEKILKGSDVSIWLRNIQLAMLAIPISLIVIRIQDYGRVIEGGFTQGFDAVVWSIVSIQALGGLVVAVVIKYADNILKAFATSISIVVSAIASIFLFSIIPETLFIVGATLVIFAVVIYSIFPYKEVPKPAISAKKETK